MQFCGKCGKEIIDNSLFCGECGQRLKDINPVQNVNEKIKHIIKHVVKKASVFLKEKNVLIKKMSPKKIGMCVLIPVFAVIICFFVFRKSDEEKILNLTNNLAISINEGDFEKMISCFKPSVQNKVDALMKTGSSLLGYADLKDIWSLGSIEMSENEEVYICVYELTVKKDTALAKISFSFDDGKSDSVGTVELTKIDGKWYFEEF